MAPVLRLVPDTAALFAPEGDDEASFARLRAAEGTGRPLGNAQFITGLERILGRRVARRAPGRKPRTPSDDVPNLL